MLSSFVACYVGHGARIRIGGRHCGAVADSFAMINRVYGNDMPAEVEWGDVLRFLKQNEEGEKGECEKQKEKSQQRLDGLARQC